MRPSAPDEARPFVETSIARLMRSRLGLTHEECGISVISGPWGVGKTWAIDAFVKEIEFGVAVVKVEPASTKKGATCIMVMQMVLESLSTLLNYREVNHPNSHWILRRSIYNMLNHYRSVTWDRDDTAQFTFIFDEAQYLSREAIEMLRFWNDSDRTTTPFPVGLIFVGNNEFALQEDASGESVLSGAVRSRLLFQEFLQYANLGDSDLSLFLQSRGITDPGAIAEFLRYFSSPGRPRDLRYAERQASFFRRRAGDGPVTGEMVRNILNV
ncbi:ATP-binding protein [Sphingomonas sp. RP10(2022)]|uniref:ATP-binding protein n=1 Tax=Sphingomonas liriopis TaxID=2949094 RepID=A0A9X2HRP5_9SPHN|nr:ATP-binding protein [Sphingomonas liriopis]MCP3735968.1 ATP-binding protein [Sphingomonas liriopis]